MPGPKLDQLLHRRPVRVSVGFLTGLLFGPSIAYLLVHAPSNEWLGPYPPYVDDCAVMAAMIGVCCGLAVGLIVPLLALNLQRWKWRWSDPASVPWYPAPEGTPDRPDRGINGDERFSRRTDITGPTS